MKLFYPALEASAMNQQVEKAKQKNAWPIQFNGCVDTQICHLMNFLGRDEPQKLILTYSEERARKLYEDYRCFDRNVFYYPAKDVLFYSADVHGNAIVNQRLEVVRALLEKEPVTVITTIDGGMDRLIPLKEMEHYVYHVRAEQELDLEDFAKKLVDLGYENETMVEKPGQFAMRGGILDVFPLGEEAPYRIELWGDEVDTIRSFDVESQRSIETVGEITIYPATEMPLTVQRMHAGKESMKEEYEETLSKFKKEQRTKEAGNLKQTMRNIFEEMEMCRQEAAIDSFITYFYGDTVSFIDYFEENTAVFIEEPSWMKESGLAVENEFQTSMEGRLSGGYALAGQAEVFFPLEDVLRRLKHYHCCYFSKIGYEDPEFSVKTVIEMHCHRTNTYQNHFELLVSDMKKWKEEGYRAVLLSASATRARRLAKELEEEGLTAYFVETLENEVVPGQIGVTTGSLSCGFLYTDEKIAILSENDVVKRKSDKKRRTAPRYKGEVIKNFDDLSIGDYVVHEDRGVGIYRGIVKKEQDGVEKDYIAIEYAEGAMYYIAVSQMGKVQRYASSGAKKPKLNKLGSREWEKTKQKVQGKVGDLAKELVELYAIRRQQKGFACDKDTVWQNEFEEMFPYDETDDQLKAIAETKADMESDKIMDRLICGDVGYGKTEVALRAAFKAVTNSKQVVYLVPTTVLAEQHYNTFCQRMKDYPITIGMLSRFRTAKERKQVKEQLKSGEMDIVIGTHALFGKDIVYKDLGLLIIDEEQRFGVAHKEKIKQMKKNIDVLALSATPIPRTLHMSLSGIRDMSLLREAPVNRHAIQTYVLEYNEEMVKEAIKRELARGGQVYYVYNRVKNIEEIAMRIQELVPGAVVAYGHGQMGEHELERLMMDFVDGKIDVLVSTTIIETGLDIPNVNTIIIHDADNFGLAQLYQLRGRVGRSGRRAFAFLMYRRDKMIHETAQKRLAAIREFTDLGSGFKIAMRDLEIRGAGNVLGKDQSGHMEAVGYDLYCKMLNQAVAELKGDYQKITIDTTIDVELDALIPATYVRNEFQKLELYKRISGISSREALEDMTDELIDRFGEIPEATNNLLEIALLKNTASKYYITKIRQVEGFIAIGVYAKAPVKVQEMDGMLKEYKGCMSFSQEKEPIFKYQTKHLKKSEILPTIRQIVDRIGALMEP